MGGGVGWSWRLGALGVSIHIGALIYRNSYIRVSQGENAPSLSKAMKGLTVIS